MESSLLANTELATRHETTRSVNGKLSIGYADMREVEDALFSHYVTVLESV
jgi:hypothetical protein